MKFAYLLGGGTPTIKKYKMALGHLAGIIVIEAAAGATGLTTSTNTAWTNAVGLTLDAILSAGAPVTYSTTQGAVEYLQSVIINPDAVFAALLCGSAVSAQMEQRTVGTASSNGLTVVGTVGDTDPSSPDMDEGTVWYNSGVNGGASRKITSTTTTLTVTVVMPFAANVIGDKYLTVAATPGSLGVTMTTDLVNIDGSAAKQGANARVIDMQLNGRANSYLELTASDHVFGTAT